MSLNPLVLIERLIEEHGSSTIQGKHLSLLKEQIAILKEQRAESEVKAALSETRIRELESENQNLRQEIHKLQPSAQGMDDNAAKILKFYFESNESLAISYVASRLGIQPSEAEAHASDLYKLGYIGLTAIGDSPCYAIYPDGSKYVMKHLR